MGDRREFGRAWGLRPAPTEAVQLLAIIRPGPIDRAIETETFNRWRNSQLATEYSGGG